MLQRDLARVAEVQRVMEGHRHPGCRPDHGFKPSHAVLVHGATLPPTPDSARGDLFRLVRNALRQPGANFRAGPLPLAAAWAGGADQQADVGLADAAGQPSLASLVASSTGE
jgi:hypothetical protein